MGEPVEGRLVAHGVSTRQQREEIGHGRNRFHPAIFARRRISRTAETPE
jgi:hypothetical protein